MRHRTSILLLASSLVACGLSVAPAEEKAAITVHLRDGRTQQAAIDHRTDATTLWLRFESAHITLLRPVPWTDVTGATVNQQRLDAAQFREQAGDLATREQRAERIPPGPVVISPVPGRTMAEKARWVLDSTPRIRGFTTDAVLANWDADVEHDGLSIFVAPFASPGVLVPVAATVEVQLYAPLQQTFSDVPQGRGQSLEQIGTWSVPISLDQYTPLGANIQLPFERFLPEFDDRVGPIGMVQIRLVVPGHGVFDRRVEVVRLRPFSPLRDRFK